MTLINYLKIITLVTMSAICILFMVSCASNMDSGAGMQKIPTRNNSNIIKATMSLKEVQVLLQKHEKHLQPAVKAIHYNIDGAYKVFSLTHDQALNGHIYYDSLYEFVFADGQLKLIVLYYSKEAGGKEQSMKVDRLVLKDGYTFPEL